jgi:hypothetical protein
VTGVIPDKESGKEISSESEDERINRALTGPALFYSERGDSCNAFGLESMCVFVSHVKAEKRRVKDGMEVSTSLPQRRQVNKPLLLQQNKSCGGRRYQPI